MSQLLKEMFRKLADKSGYGSPRSRSRPRPDNNNSPNASPILDLSHRGRRSRSGSLRRRLREEQLGASAPESRSASPVLSKLRELVYPPEPKRFSTSPGIFGRRDVPLQAPEHLHNASGGIDFYPKRKGSFLNADVHRIWAGVFCIIVLSLVAAYTIAHISLTKHQQEVVTSQITRDLLTSGQEDSKNEVALGYQSLLSELILRRHLESEPEIGFDFSLSTLGAKVLTTRNTKSMPHYDATFLGFSVWSGITEDSQTEAPLQPILMPGRCWRFVGFPGTLVIQLAERVSVTSFTLAHVMGSTVPKHRLTSAPFEFEVLGLDETNDQSPHLFGNYTMQLNGVSSQDFEVQFPSTRLIPIVELRVLSNHGSTEYTCVYRFKVFGVSQDFD